MSPNREIAVFGAGCFWGVEDAFRGLAGVAATRVGFAGGTAVAPTYRDVCDGGTGHAEVVEVTFDPSATSYEALLEYFWSQHDPTHEHKDQYRSVVVCATPDHYRRAVAMRERLDASGRFSRPIRTEIVGASPFYEAEPYHQQYFEKQRARSLELLEKSRR